MALRQAMAAAMAAGLLVVGGTSAVRAAKKVKLPENLALRAKVTADSEHGAPHRAAFVADGKIPGIGGCDDAGKVWAVNGATHKDGATLTFQWPQPVTIAQIVYYSRTAHAVEGWRGYEVYLDQAATPAARGEFKCGYGPQPIRLPKPAAARTLRLKFTSSYKSLNPGASEVQVFGADPPAGALGAFKPLPVFQIYNGAARAGTPPPPPVNDSPQLAAALKAGRLGFDRLVVVQRHELNPSHVYTYHAESFRAGGGLFVHTPADGALKQLVAAATGEIIDCDVSYDGTEILFSWKKSGRSQDRYAPLNFAEEKTFHVYRIRADGTGLTQLTDGLTNNFNACWLPDGNVAFLSDRRPAFAYCFTTTSPILHRMDRDGGNVRRISASYLNDFTPSVLHDGRILYSRWEYIDRPAIPIQSLWAIHPDGTGVAGYFGNRVISPGTFMEAHAIPGSTKVLCVLTSHNGPCRGAIGVIDVARGANAQDAIRNVTPEVNIGRVDAGNGNNVRGPYESPWPLDEKHFLVSHRGTILLRDYDRTEQTVVLGPQGGMGFYSARPLAPRTRPPVRQSALPAGAPPWATIVLQDVYQGLAPHVRPGEIKQLCIVQEIEKSRRVPLVDQVPTGRGYAANSAFGFQFPLVSCGATYAPKKIWGYVPVEPDGSAHFKVPTGLPIYFFAIDAQGRAVQRMRTFTHFMPGEEATCVGCHVDRNYVTALPGRGRPAAAGRAPTELTPPEWGDENFSFWRVVQPVFDQHCIRCHNAREHPGGVDLTGDRTDFFSVSYDVLTRKGTPWADHPERHGGGQVTSPYTSWISTANGSESNILAVAPRRWGSPASKLADIILAGHPDKDHKPRVTVPPAQQRRVMAWIDLNVPYYGTSVSNYPRRMGCRRMLPPDLAKTLQTVAARRCAACHKPGGKAPAPIPRTFYTRMLKPEDNNFLLAPLSKSAGGLGTCGQNVFRTTSDPDYQALLVPFQPIQEMLRKTPRMDMPGATPPPCPAP